MNNLQIINHNGTFVVDSREVAEMVEKRHADLIRDIETYISYLGQNANLRSDEFFIESSYLAGTGKPYKCYLITKKGCDMVANKMTGEKGVIFTALYVTRFEEMEKELSQSQLPLTVEDMIIMQANSVKELKAKVEHVEVNAEFAKEQAITAHQRIDAMDNTDLIGDLQQRLVRKVQKYAERNGLTYSTGWRDFRQCFNTAFRTNISLRKKYHMESRGIKKMTVPEYLAATEQLPDALRVAEKMLQSGHLFN